MKEAFTRTFPEDLAYDEKSRLKKAKKIIAVLQDYYRELGTLRCLDVGCSVGIITRFMGEYFDEVTGTDVDEVAIAQAKKARGRKNVKFVVSKENRLPFPNDTFDVVVMNQVYEHTVNPKGLLSEVKRVLKKDGVCFFGARNKYGGPFDGHYSLPFVSWLPRSLSNIYIKLFTEKSKYDIALYSLFNLKKLVKGYKVYDYTLEVIKDPVKYSIREQVPTFLDINKLFYLVGKIVYPFIPNYIWLLIKP